MSIFPNRHHLKELSAAIVDFQFVQQQATQVFSYNGEATADFEEAAKQLDILFSDILTQVQSLKTKIPGI